MTGYRSKFFRHECPSRGCYVSQLPSWDDLIEALPRKIRPTDIDGLIEIGGHVLFLEEKSEGKSPDMGQLRAIQALAALPGVRVLIFRPKGDDMEVLTYPNPSGYQQMTRQQFVERIQQWCHWADNNPLHSTRSRAS